MSVFETFFILFKSDSKDLKKGAEEAQQVTNKLDQSLKNVGHEANKLGTSFKDLIRAAAGYITAFSSISTLSNGIKSAIDYTTALNQTSKQLNVNINDLHAWGRAVQQAGGSAEGFQGSLKSLASHFGSTASTALKVLPQLADVFKRLSPERAQQYGKLLGLDESTILLLQRGRREVDEVIRKQKEQSSITEKDRIQYEKFNQVLINTKQANQDLYSTLAISALPILTKMFEVVEKGIRYFTEHKDLVIGGLIGILTVSTLLAAPFIAANAVIIAVTAGIALLIGAFALVYDDIQAFLNGNKSFIGYLLKEYPRVGAVIKAVFSGIGTAIRALFHPLETLQNLLNKVWSKIAAIFAHNKKIEIDIRGGQRAVNSSDNSFVSKLGGTLNSSFKNQTTNIDKVIVNTQATDGKQLAQDFTGHLNSQIEQSNSNVDDGLVA